MPANSKKFAKASTRQIEPIRMNLPSPEEEIRKAFKAGKQIQERGASDISEVERKALGVKRANVYEHRRVAKFIGTEAKLESILKTIHGSNVGWTILRELSRGGVSYKTFREHLETAAERSWTVEEAKEANRSARAKREKESKRKLHDIKEARDWRVKIH